MSILLKGTEQKGDMNVNSKEFLNLICSDDSKSVKKLHSLLKELAELHEEKDFREG